MLETATFTEAHKQNELIDRLHPPQTEDYPKSRTSAAVKHRGRIQKEMRVRPKARTSRIATPTTKNQPSCSSLAPPLARQSSTCQDGSAHTTSITAHTLSRRRWGERSKGRRRNTRRRKLKLRREWISSSAESITRSTNERSSLAIHSVVLRSIGES